MQKRGRRTLLLLQSASFCVKRIFSFAERTDDEVHDLADGRQLRGLVVRDDDVVALLECHGQFNDIEGVGAEVIDDARVLMDVLRLDLKLLCEDAAYGFINLLSCFH